MSSDKKINFGVCPITKTKICPYMKYYKFNSKLQTMALPKKQQNKTKTAWEENFGAYINCISHC